MFTHDIHFLPIFETAFKTSSFFLPFTLEAVTLLTETDSYRMRIHILSYI